MIIGAALVAVLSNVAVADEDIDMRGPKGWSQFFKIEGYDLNPRNKLMKLLIVPQKNCEEMVVSFDAEKDGIVESLGGYFKLKDTQAGRKHRETMVTDLKPGGILILKSVTCFNNNNRQYETLDSKKGFIISDGGSRPSSSTPSPSLMDLPFFKR